MKLYNGNTNPVPIPKTGGKVRIYSNGYVYWITSSKWDNEKKQTIDDRKSIGHIDKSHPGMMFPGSNYFRLGLDKQIEKSDEIVLQPPGKFSKTLNFGQYVAMTKALDQIGCLDVLKKIQPRDWKAILALCIHAVDAENSVAQDFPNWAFHNYCGLDKPMTDSEISRLYKRIGSDEETGANFMYYYREAFHKAFPDTKEVIGALDSTNQNTSSGNNRYAEHGHAKINEGIPDVNTAVFCDETTGIPIYYEHFYGSILDKTETPFTIEKMEDLGYQKLFAMMDRGYCSEKVADAFEGYDQIHFGVSCPDNFTSAISLIDQYGSKIKDKDEYYLPESHLYGIHVPDQKILGGKYDTYIFYDSERAELERESIEDKVQALIKAASQKKRYTDRLSTKYFPFLLITKCEKDQRTGRNFSIIRNNDKIQEDLNRAGFFVVVSNSGMDAGSMGQIVKHRDQCEKVFQRLKSHFGLTKTYTHGTDTYRGKMFVAFVALIMVISYRWYIRTDLKRASSETTATSIGNLSKYQIRQKNDGTWMPMYAMTKSQRELFSELGLSVKDVEGLARSIKLRV